MNLFTCIFIWVSATVAVFWLGRFYGYLMDYSTGWDDAVNSTLNVCEEEHRKSLIQAHLKGFKQAKWHYRDVYKGCICKDPVTGRFVGRQR